MNWPHHIDFPFRITHTHKYWAIGADQLHEQSSHCDKWFTCAMLIKAFEWFCLFNQMELNEISEPSKIISFNKWWNSNQTTDSLSCTCLILNAVDLGLCSHFLFLSVLLDFAEDRVVIATNLYYYYYLPVFEWEKPQR